MLQVADFSGDDALVAGQLRALAAALAHACSMAKWSAPRCVVLRFAIFRLLPHHGAQLLKHALVCRPADALLAEMPHTLLPLLVQALLRRVPTRTEHAPAHAAAATTVSGPRLLLPAPTADGMQRAGALASARHSAALRAARCSRSCHALAWAV